MSARPPADTNRAGESGALDVFLRRSSGLVRELSIFDATLFGVLASGLFFSFVYFFPYPQYITPGIDTPLMLVIGTLASIPVIICYAALGSAMPRAGGDYLYDSRTVAPAIGFSIPLGMGAFVWTILYPLGTFVIVTYALGPVLSAAAAEFDVSTFQEWSEWLQTTTGRLIATIVLSLLAWLITIRGVRVYRFIQRGIFLPAIVITNAVLLIQLATSSSDGFRESFDEFPANREADITHDGVLSAAREAGWQDPSFSLGDTLLWIPVMLGVVPFVVYAAEGMMGEVKRARDFERVARSLILGGLYIGVFVFGLLYFLLEQRASREFISALTFVSNEGAVELPYELNITTFSAFLNDNFFLVLAISLGFIASAFQLMTAVMMNETRVLVSMGLDRTLPARFASVNMRFHAPIFAATVYLVFVLGMGVWFTYSESWFTVFTYLSVYGGQGVLLFGCLAATLLPFRARHIYEASPVAKYRIGGFPAISVIGAIGTVLYAISWYIIATNDKVGLTGAGLDLPADPRWLVVAPVAVLLVFFFVWQRMQRSRGIDTSLVFREVPPE
jgi:APA family basic amino acid/polyamine antiporter